MKYLFIVITYLILTSLSCKKNNDNKDQLPPITQTGANTFGCLVNGKIWIPQGYSGTGTPNPKLAFDFVSGRNIFSINSYHYENNTPKGFLSISFLDTVLKAGIYDYPNKMNFSIGWENAIGSCFTPAFDTSVKKWGKATITKYDNANRIISGTFDCKFKSPSCDTVYLTEGRFDFKF